MNTQTYDQAQANLINIDQQLTSMLRDNPVPIAGNDGFEAWRTRLLALQQQREAAVAALNEAEGELGNVPIDLVLTGETS